MRRYNWLSGHTCPLRKICKLSESSSFLLCENLAVYDKKENFAGGVKVRVQLYVVIHSWIHSNLLSTCYMLALCRGSSMDSFKFTEHLLYAGYHFQGSKHSGEQDR